MKSGPSGVISPLRSLGTCDLKVPEEPLQLRHGKTPISQPAPSECCFVVLISIPTPEEYRVGQVLPRVNPGVTESPHPNYIPPASVSILIQQSMILRHDLTPCARFRRLSAFKHMWTSGLRRRRFVESGAGIGAMVGHRTAWQQLLSLLVAGLALTEANKVRRPARCSRS